MTNQELYEMAVKAREFSYSPYSNFKVGAALLAKNGTVYTGCNIENAAYTPCNCAERTAFFKAVSEGETEFLRIAVVGGNAEENEPSDYCPPCGICRQVLSEFCGRDFKVIVAKSTDDFEEHTLGSLLPYSFSL